MSGVLNKVYTFEVAKSANKIEIAKACEELFKVEVAKVNTVSVRGKFRRQGRNNGGYSKSWKKAIITLKENSKPIEFFEGDDVSLKNYSGRMYGKEPFSRKAIMRRVKPNGN